MHQNVYLMRTCAVIFRTNFYLEASFRIYFLLDGAISVGKKEPSISTSHSISLLKMWENCSYLVPVAICFRGNTYDTYRRPDYTIWWHDRCQCQRWERFYVTYLKRLLKGCPLTLRTAASIMRVPWWWWEEGARVNAAQDTAHRPIRRRVQTTWTEFLAPPPY